MEAKLAQNDLSKAFKALKLTLPDLKKAILPACSGVHLKADSASGKVVATTYDTTSFTQVELTAQNVIDGERLINGAKLIEFVNRVDGGDIELATGNNHTTKLVYAGGKPLNMVGMDPANYPNLPNFNPSNTFDITTDELKLLVKRTSWAHLKGEAEAKDIILTGVGISVKDDGNGGHILSLSATNRVNAAYKGIPVQTAAGEFDLVIKGDQLLEVTNIMPAGETCQISWDHAFVMFKAGGITYFGRQLAAQYPNLKGNLQKFMGVKGASFEVKREDLLKTLGLVDVIVSGPDANNNQATFAFTGGNLEIHGEQDSVGTITENVAGTLNGGDLTLEWKVPIVRDALKAMDADEVVFELPAQPNLPTVVHPKGDNEELFLILAVAKK